MESGGNRDKVILKFMENTNALLDKLCQDFERSDVNHSYKELSDNRTLIQLYKLLIESGHIYK